MGRPSDYTPEIADAICLRIAEGESLRKICKDAAMPDKSTVMRWLLQHADFRDQYARAREAQADVLADEILAIADASEHDFSVVDGEPAVNHENIQRSRLRVDARKWAAAKIAPKKYGERIVAEHSGPDGKPIQSETTVTRFTLSIFDKLPDDNRESVNE